MAHYASVSYVGDGSTDTFSIPFGYLEQTHIKVYIDGSEETNKIFPTNNQVQLTIVPTQGAIVTIKRETPKERLVDFQNASILDEEVFDLDSNQMMYVIQEASDEADNSLQKNLLDEWDAKGKPIKNVGEGTEDTDAMTLKAANTKLAEMDAVKTETVSIRDQTQAIADNAAVSANDAATSATNASTSETKAQQYAENAEIYGKRIFVQSGEPENPQANDVWIKI